MTDHSTAGVYTFYDWLMAIFRGQKSPSRNEFDQDYSDYIHKQKVGGNITDAELKALENNAMAKVNYELKNMFPQVNKITFGRITTFCPLFCADDVLKDLESSYVTVSRVSQVLEEIRGLHRFLPGKSGYGALRCHGQGNDTFRISAGYHPHAECRHPRCHVAGDRR